MKLGATTPRVSLEMFVGAQISNKPPEGLLNAMCLLALLPSVYVLLTWDNDGKLGLLAYAMRHLSLPVSAAELFAIYLTSRQNFEIRTGIAKLDLVTKLLLGIWLIFACLPILVANSYSPQSALVTLQYGLHGIFLAALIYLADTNQNERVTRETALLLLLSGGVAYVGILTVFALLVPNKETFPWTMRLPSGTNIRQIGYFVAIMAVVPFSLALFSQKRNVVYSLILAGFVAFIAWTGSRGALAGLFFGMLAGTVFVGRIPMYSRILMVLLSIIFGLAVSLTLPTPAPEFGLVRIVSSVEQGEIGNGRFFVWESTLTEILKSPLIGHGSGSFKHNMQEAYGLDFNHPHQFILQFVYDWGLIGGIAAGVLLLKLFLFCLTNARVSRDSAGVAALSSMCTLAAVGLIDGALFYPFSIFLALSIVACGFISGQITHLNALERSS